MSETYKKKGSVERYDIARALPDTTSAQWMEVLLNLVPAESVKRILDLGGGTGRFVAALQKTYKCPVVVIDPSEEMLKQGRNRRLDNISWLLGSAEDSPLNTGLIDLVWMSQVFHHLEDPPLAFKEIYRVLCSTGYLAIRNGTQESDAEIEWIKCFPEAKELNKGIIPRRINISNQVCLQGFDIVKIQAVNQLFASSYNEYYDKISQRGLSSLISISDDAFNAGLQRLLEWVTSKLQNQPVYELVDLFIFRKRGSLY
jgi:ubiquinone/menaquinone biosynthesis C-methylase UbiE